MTPWCAVHFGRLSSMHGPSGPTLTRQGRKRDVVACRPPRRCVAAYCHAGQRSHQAWALMGVMKHVYITHAVRRRISQHLLMQRPRLHDVLCTLWRYPQRLCELTLWRYRRTSSNFAIVLILPNTQRSEKVKRRKGNRASTVVVVAFAQGENFSSVLTRGCADVIQFKPTDHKWDPCSC